MSDSKRFPIFAAKLVADIKPKRQAKARSPNKKGIVLRLPDDAIEIPTHRNTKVIISNTIPVDTNTKLQLLRILELEKEYPNGIYGFKPPLFKEFIDSKNNINTRVSIGNTVRLGVKYKKDINEIRVVKDLYFSSLNNMTIIVAKLDNGDYYPSYQLEKVCN